MSREISLSDNALEVARTRYFMEGEEWKDCVARVARSVATAELDKAKEYEEKFSEIIYNMDFIPAGRILRNCGRQKGSLFNCYHLPIGDSIEEIGQYNKDSLILWSEGGGVGCNFSTLRPIGTNILGKGGTSSGLLSFLKASDGLAATIESGGQRRAAGLALVDVSHPEVMDVIDAKLVHGIIQHYNISIAVNRDFLEAVETNGDWEFKFKQKSYGTKPAREIWHKIIQNMVTCAEPGLINWDRLQKNNSYYYDPIRGTNPCGEAVLEPYGVCNLGSLVLPNFITGTINTNWKKLEETIKLAVRFLDNVIDINKYTLKEIDIKAHNSRRIGLGVMGLADYLFAKKIRYGSPACISEIDRLMRFIRDATYTAMVELAVEKFAFPMFDPIPYWKGSFIRGLPSSLRTDIKEKGVRCVTGLSIAPNGTISLIADVNGGIEPLPAKAYERKDRVSERVYVHPKFKEILESGEEVPDWYVDIFDLTPTDHLEVQATVQKYVDGAVSKTINLPSTCTDKDLDKLLLEHIHDLKGCTVYVDGSRKGQIINPMPVDKVKQYLLENEPETHLTEDDVKCSSGSCSI